MKLYFVLSESRTVAVYEDWFNNVGHYEDSCIAELVLANKPSQARYLAWKEDDHFTYDFRDMPKMRSFALTTDVICETDVPCVVTNDPLFKRYWNRVTNEMSI